MAAWLEQSPISWPRTGTVSARASRLVGLAFRRPFSYFAKIYRPSQFPMKEAITKLELAELQAHFLNTRYPYTSAPMLFCLDLEE